MSVFKSIFTEAGGCRCEADIDYFALGTEFSNGIRDVLTCTKCGTSVVRKWIQCHVSTEIVSKEEAIYLKTLHTVKNIIK